VSVKPGLKVACHLLENAMPADGTLAGQDDNFCLVLSNQGKP
jgi:hypothetical protein